MNKGLSAWLFSKMVMLSFLLIVFSIMGGFLTILNERAFNDSASILCLQAREYLSGVVNSNVISVEKIMPIPKVLPSETNQKRRMYYLVISYSSSDNSVSFAVTHDLYHDQTYVSSSLLYLPSNSGIQWGSGDLRISSDKYRYLVIQKKQGETTIYACKGINPTTLKNCISSQSPSAESDSIERV